MLLCMLSGFSFLKICFSEYSMFNHVSFDKMEIRVEFCRIGLFHLHIGLDVLGSDPIFKIENIQML